jgi:hypothetical protein
MGSRSARFELYMKAGTVGLSTRGAIVRMKDGRPVTSAVTTRLTGGTVVELELDTYYMYEFNVSGDGKFTLAVRADGGKIDLERDDFDSGGAKEGPHSERSFPFKVQG